MVVIWFHHCFLFFQKFYLSLLGCLPCWGLWVFAIWLSQIIIIIITIITITIRRRMAEQLQQCINNHQAPEWITTGRTALDQKDKSKGNVASNYRPITCLPIMLRLLTSIISESLYNYLEETDTIPHQQKGCRRKCRGTKDQLLI